MTQYEIAIKALNLVDDLLEDLDYVDRVEANRCLDNARRIVYEAEARRVLSN